MDSKLVKFYTQKGLINPTFKTVGLHPHLGTALGWKEPKLASVGLSFSQKLTQLDLAILTQEPILTLVLLFNYFFFCLYLFRGVSLRGKLSFLGTPWSHSLSTATVWSASHWNSFTGAAGFKSPAQGHHSDSHDNNEGRASAAFHFPQTDWCCQSRGLNKPPSGHRLPAPMPPPPPPWIIKTQDLSHTLKCVILPFLFLVYCKSLILIIYFICNVLSTKRKISWALMTLLPIICVATSAHLSLPFFFM